MEKKAKNEKTFTSLRDRAVNIKIEHLTKFKGLDLSDITDAAFATMEDTFSFSLGTMSGMERPTREQVERYFDGVLLVPERELFVGRVDGTIAGSIQVSKPSPSNKTSDFAVSLDNHFVAPWARGHGIARALLTNAENYAKSHKYSLIKLSVRATRTAAISLYENSGYMKWGVLDKYERLGDKIVPGFFYCKEI